MPGQVPGNKGHCMTTIILRNGHVKPLWAGHPWVFAQAIQTIEGAPTAGDVVRITNQTGTFLGQGFYSPHSAIPVRILSNQPTDVIDAGFLQRRIETAKNLRNELLHLPAHGTNGYRLVHSEGDYLGGLIVDMYGDVAAVQLLTIGMKRRQEEIFATIQRLTQAKSIVEIARASTARLEGFEASTQVVRGANIDALNFTEMDIQYTVPIEVGQKTGFYFDQRETRQLVKGLAAGRRVLDAFCYLGSFSLAALAGGAESAVAVDSSAAVLAAAAAVAESNGFGGRVEFTRADVRTFLPSLAAQKSRFDLVIVDPPKLAPSSKHLNHGRKADEKLNAAALRLVEPQGLMLTCSCSAAMRAEDFLRTLSLAAVSAKRHIQVLRLTTQAPDHPTLPAFPEGRYLKVALLKVD